MSGHPKVHRRPTWVIVLAVSMMAFGGHLLMGGLSTVRNLWAPRAVTIESPEPHDSATVPEVDATADGAVDAVLLRDMRAMSQRLDRDHPWAVRLNAGSKVVLGLVLLFATAAVWSSDPRGRLAALLAAWAGIAYHVGDALFLLLVLRKGVIAAAPALATLASRASRGATEAPSVEAMVSFADTFMIVLSVVTAVGGIGFSVVLMKYFGGHKGRLLYGLEPPGRVHAPHGS